MKVMKSLLCGLMVLAIAASVAAPAGATTLRRESLDDLVAGNGTIVLGEVVDAVSYWNNEGTFILTDVRITPFEVLKGAVKGPELTITIMGGRVGDTTTLIVGGPRLIPGDSYMLFLNEEDLPGARALTVRDLIQGIFDVRMDRDGLRAVSQATGHPLLPDAAGVADAPGGLAGTPLSSMMKTVRELVDRPERIDREVN